MAFSPYSAIVLDVPRQERYSRVLVLVRPLLVLPHLAALVLVYFVAWLAWLMSLFYALRRGNYPRLLFDYMTGAGRWTANLLAFGLMLTDRYPRFALEPRPGDAVRLDVAYPVEGRVARRQPLVAWLLALPQLFMLLALDVCLALASVAAGAAIAATGRHPRALFDFTLRVLRLHARVNCYVYFMTPQYPGFAL